MKKLFFLFTLLLLSTAQLYAKPRLKKLDDIVKRTHPTKKNLKALEYFQNHIASFALIDQIALSASENERYKKKEGRLQALLSIFAVNFENDMAGQRKKKR